MLYTIMLLFFILCFNFFCYFLKDDSILIDCLSIPKSITGYKAAMFRNELFQFLYFFIFTNHFEQIHYSNSLLIIANAFSRSGSLHPSQTNILLISANISAESRVLST